MMLNLLMVMLSHLSQAEHLNILTGQTEDRESSKVSREACPGASMMTACSCCLSVLLPPPPPPPPPPPLPPRESTFSVSPAAAPDVKFELLSFLMIVIPATLIVLLIIFTICYKMLSRKQTKTDENGTNPGGSTNSTIINSNNTTAGV